MGECVRGVGVSRDGCVSRVGYSVRGESDTIDGVTMSCTTSSLTNKS